ncbi:aminoacetone oxidase family FAD-binding enzyme [Sulfurimonas sp.]|uniref:NAD(P)/FAD-dependent oxidoreductase n=1 Tax=Sulfurimonas sp. TaxID=2022749 RepID=UPI002B46A352|nr:aminoacetone oxidase family FAD-binding enzyme [Sulfurimonas sp.]
MKIYDVIILGAGASGLMCASHLSEKLNVSIIDINSKVAQKLKISGGGKCNITSTSVSSNNFDGDEEFISNILSEYSKENLLEFLKINSLFPVIRKNRYYFCKNSSDEIINILKKLSNKHELILNTKVSEVKKVNKIFEIVTDRKILKAKKVIVATGGKSFQTLGASDIGLKIAKNFDISVKEFTPALVGMTLQKDQFWMKELSGLSCFVHIKVDEKTLKEDLLFAHRGISGPAVLSASLYWKKAKMAINFLPKNKIKDLIRNSKKLVSSAIPLPKRLSIAILKAIDVQDKECKKLSSKEVEKLLDIHNYEFAPAGNFGFTKAEVSRGGVCAKELHNHSLESKSIKNLHFIGEVVDVTGELGGYNFQWAFSSGVICAREINSVL